MTDDGVPCGWTGPWREGAGTPRTLALEAADVMEHLKQRHEWLYLATWDSDTRSFFESGELVLLAAQLPG